MTVLFRSWKNIQWNLWITTSLGTEDLRRYPGVSLFRGFQDGGKRGRGEASGESNDAMHGPVPVIQCDKTCPNHVRMCHCFDYNNNKQCFDNK